MTTATTSSPGDANPADGAVTFTLNLGGAAPITSPSPPIPPSSSSGSGAKRTTASGFATLSFHTPKAVLLRAKHPAITLVMTASAATTLTLKLYDSKGHKLAGWTKKAHAGPNTFALVLPTKARHKGRETLRVSETGNPTAKALVVTLKP